MTLCLHSHIIWEFKFREGFTDSGRKDVLLHWLVDAHESVGDHKEVCKENPVTWHQNEYLSPNYFGFLLWTNHTVDQMKPIFLRILWSFFVVTHHHRHLPLCCLTSDTNSSSWRMPADVAFRLCCGMSFKWKPLCFSCQTTFTNILCLTRDDEHVVSWTVG